MSEKTILVVEDNTLFAELVANSLQSHGYTVHVANNANDAKRIFRSTDPDGVVLDIDLGTGPTGFDFAHVINQESPGVGIVFLTKYPDSRFAPASEFKFSKNVAYLRKHSLGSVNLLLEALDVAMRGEVRGDLREDLGDTRVFDDVTSKQIEVLNLMAQGKTNKQIAEDRGTSLKAAEDTISRACKAVGIDSNVEGNVRTAAVLKYLEAFGLRLPPR